MIEYDFSLLTPPPEGEQNTEEWLNARRGRITASKRAHQILNSRKLTLNLMMDEMAQELTRPAEDWGGNAATRHGHAFEDQAIDEYRMARLSFGEIERSPGMFVHPEFDIASATPDFFEGESTTGQIKCPYKLKNHLNLLHFGVRMVNPAYYTQVQFESFVTRRPHIVFVSYHPEAPATNQLYIEGIDADRQMHEAFRAKLSEINHMLVNNERYDVAEPVAGIDGIPDIF
jgi:hypothetical protein